jgi:hypothetical protein
MSDRESSPHSTSSGDEAPEEVIITPPPNPHSPTFIDNFDMLEDEDDKYSLSEKIVHFVGGRLLPEHFDATRAVLVFHAGATVGKLPPHEKGVERKQMHGFI